MRPLWSPPPGIESHTSRTAVTDVGGVRWWGDSAWATESERRLLKRNLLGCRLTTSRNDVLVVFARESMARQFGTWKWFFRDAVIY
ncbi:hypothetical protein Zmor_019859 [Zophobas morio]|uniref:Uncharacterized protein n=1 Tax=Zophobas morio TaxID=2755281 RepID=A0AA38M995_9CUCU|nr:hypothetical protein Zmor_019859 [Zophobas morio]